MHLVNKENDPVHRRLDFLDKAVGSRSLCHHIDIQTLFPQREVYFAIIVCFLILSVRLWGRHTTTYVALSAALVTWQTRWLVPVCLFSISRYRDRKLALFIESKYQNSNCCSQSTMKKLVCIVGRGWLVTFWRGSWNYFQIRPSWRTAGSILFYSERSAKNNNLIFLS